MRKFIWTILAVLIFVSPALALTQDPIADPGYMFTGARLASLGLSPATMGDINAIYINPAVIGPLEILQFNLSHRKFLDLFDYSSFTVTMPYMDFSVGLSYGTFMDSIPRTARDGDHIFSDSAFLSGTNMFQTTLSRVLYNYQMFDLMSFGLDNRIYQQVVDDATRFLTGFDGGVTGVMFFKNQLLYKLELGASMHNFAQFGGTASGAGLPSFFTLGARADVLNGQCSFFANNNYNSLLSVGSEYHFPGNVDLRGSTNFNSLNVGVGITFEHITGLDYQDYNMRLDYDYQSSLSVKDPLYGSNTHTFTLSFLGETKLKKPKIFQPRRTTIVRENETTLSGIAEPESNVLIYNNKTLTKTLNTDEFGNFNAPEYKLKQGENKITFQSYTLEKNASDQTPPVSVISDKDMPTIRLTALPKGDKLVITAQSVDKLFRVTGMLDSEQLVFSRQNDSIWRAVTDLPPQWANNAYLPIDMNNVVVYGFNSANQQSDTNKMPIFLTVYRPKDRTVEFRDWVEITGEISPMVQSVSVDKQRVVIDKQRHFAMDYPLKLGKNYIPVKATLIDNQAMNYSVRVLRLMTFPDIRNRPSQRLIEYLVTLGYVNGKPDGLYHPDSHLTRIELARVLCRINNIQVQTADLNLFRDVMRNDSAAPFIQAVVQQGYMTGFADNTFKPKKAISVIETIQAFRKAGHVPPNMPLDNSSLITRAQFAQMLANTSFMRGKIYELTTW